MAHVVANGTYFGEALRVRHSAGLSLAETRYAAGTVVPEHAHETALCVLVLEGAFEEHAVREPDVCVAGSLLVIPAGMPHAHHFLAPRSRAFTVQFGSDWLQRLAAEDDWVPRQHAVLSGGPGSWRAARLYHAFRTAASEPALTFDEIALETLCVAARSDVSEAGAERRARWLAAVRDYVHAHFREGLSLSEVAQVAGVNASYLSRAFHRATGETLSALVRRLRLEHAARRLLRDDAPIGPIALDAGFADHSHFTREFKRAAGVTPQEYRALFSPARAAPDLPSAPSL